MNVNILKSCGHCMFLYGCKNKLPSLKQETLKIRRNWLVAKRQCLFTRLHSQTESLGHNPILLKTSNCLRLPAICLLRHYGFISLDTRYFIISCLCWSYVFPYLTKAVKLTRCILGWYSTDCMRMTFKLTGDAYVPVVPNVISKLNIFNLPALISRLYIHC